MAISKPRYQKLSVVKELEDSLFAEKVAKYKIGNPNIRTNHLVKQTFRDDTANGLTQCIATYIRLRGGQCERINVYGRPVDNRKIVTDVLGRTKQIGSIKWGKSTSTVGTADISATVAGRSVKIEVKIGRDRQSEDQKEYQKQIEAAGGVYMIAKDFTTWKEQFDKLFGGENL